ncbi:hypothetical protein MDG893_13194, partial [Marinobacter algicola DG893]
RWGCLWHDAEGAGGIHYHTRLEHYAHFVPLPGNLFRN